MSWFKLSARFVTFAIIYMVVVYTTVAALQPDSSSDTFSVNVPEVRMSRTTISQNDINASMEQGSAIWGGILGAVVGFIVGAVLVATGVGAPIGLAVIIGSTGLGGLIGAEVAYNVDWAAHQVGNTMFWDDFSFAVRAFFGGIFDVLVLMSGFITFGVSDAVLSGGDIPDVLLWIPFLMTFPIWLYFLVIMSGFAIEGAKAVKLW